MTPMSPSTVLATTIWAGPDHTWRSTATRSTCISDTDGSASSRVGGFQNSNLPTDDRTEPYGGSQTAQALFLDDRKRACTKHCHITLTAARHGTASETPLRRNYAKHVSWLAALLRPVIWPSP